MKRIYHKPMLIVHGSIKQITRLVAAGKVVGPSDGQANTSQGSGILGNEE